jgi:hypothetical protein
MLIRHGLQNHESDLTQRRTEREQITGVRLRQCPLVLL